MASLVFLLFLLYEAASETVVIQVVPVKPGQDATLPCDAGDGIIRAVEWTRSDPQPSKFILFWSDGHTDTPYEGRVQLVDGELKNGNVSLILKNVSREDVGTYECRVLTAGSGRNKRAIIKTDPISRVRLQVTGDQNGDTKDGDNNNGDNEEGNSTHLLVGLVVATGLISGKPRDDGLDAGQYVASGRRLCIIYKAGPAERIRPVMSLVTSATLRLLLTSAWVIVACGGTQVNVTVKPGDNATLQCRAHRDGSIKKLEWSKTDLKSDKYVFFFRENRSQEHYQLPSFRGRVELLDPQMKGDASVVLKNVTANDSGTYECVVFTSSGGGGGRSKRATPFRHIVHLKVEDSGPKAGGSEEGGSKEGGNLHDHSGLIAVIGLIAVAVPVVSVLGLIGFLVYKRPMKKNSEQPAADETQHLSTESVRV